MATGAWDRTAALMFVTGKAGANGLKAEGPDELNPYRSKAKARDWGGVFGAGRKMMEERKRQRQAEEPKGDA